MAMSGPSLLTHRDYRLYGMCIIRHFGSLIKIPWSWCLITTFPTGFPEDVTTWSYQQVFEYFNSNPDCKEYAQFFLDEEVKGEDLLDLEVNELRSYGLKLGPAKRIMKCINKLKEQQLSRNNVSEA